MIRFVSSWRRTTWLQLFVGRDPVVSTPTDSRLARSGCRSRFATVAVHSLALTSQPCPGKTLNWAPSFGATTCSLWRIRWFADDSRLAGRVALQTPAASRRWKSARRFIHRLTANREVERTLLTGLLT